MLPFSEIVPVEIIKSKLNGTGCSQTPNPYALRNFGFSYNEETPKELSGGTTFWTKIKSSSRGFISELTI